MTDERKQKVSISMHAIDDNEKGEDYGDSTLDYEFLRNFYLESKGKNTSVVFRRPMNQVQFDEEYVYKKPPRKENQFKKKSAKFATRYYEPFTSISNFGAFVSSLVPFIGWFPKYEWKTAFMLDLIAGITVGVLHVPQGIAYAVISKQDPIVGLYSSIFPALLYMIFGTSKHASIGSFAVVALMTGIAVEREAFMPGEANMENISDLPSRLEVSCCLALTSGIVYFIMGFLRLQFFTTYLSDQVVGGFTTGAAIHVFVAQCKEFFGIRGLAKQSGPGYLLRVIIDIACNVLKSNPISLSIAISTVVVLLCGKEWINPWLKKKTKINIPIPWELVVVILSTIFVFLIDGHNKFGVKVVNEIPTGLPNVVIPRFDLILRILPDAISIAVVSVAVHLSLSKMIAKRLEYEIDPGQEIFALSATSIISSILPVYPISCALGRTMVAVESGAVTQFYNFSSSMLVLSVSLYFGKFLTTLPMCVLSAIIFVALKGMLYKLGDLRGLWRLSKIDFWIWVVAFVATVLVDVSEGLIIAILFALFTTILREQYPKWHLLANVKGTPEYRDEQRYQETVYFKGVCIFKFEAPLLFHNVECFKKCIEKAYIEWKKSHEFYVVREENRANDISEMELSFEKVGTHPTASSNVLSRHFVIDCSGINCIDLMGVNALKDVFSDLRKQGVQVYFAHSKPPVREMFEKCDFFKFVSKDNFYPTLRDATAVARERQRELGFRNTAYVPDHDELLHLVDSLPNN